MTKFQSTHSAKSTLPAEAAVRNDVLHSTLEELLSFLKDKAVVSIAEHMDELFGTHWGGTINVRVVAHSHTVFVVAGVAIVSMMATFEEV